MLYRLRSIIEHFRVRKLDLFVAKLHPDADYIIFVEASQVSDMHCSKYLRRKKAIRVDPTTGLMERVPGSREIVVVRLQGPVSTSTYPQVYEIVRARATEKLTR